MKKIHYIDFLNWGKNLKKDDYLLDIGCWSRETLLKLNNKCNVFGMEIDKEKIENINPEIKNRIKKRLKINNIDGFFDLCIIAEK